MSLFLDSIYKKGNNKEDLLILLIRFINFTNKIF